VWNTDLVAFAENYIESLDGTANDVCSGNLVHSSGYGENLAYGTITATQAVDLWYDEIQYYNFADPANSDGTYEKWGHFTQLVWKSTTQIGCVIHECSGFNPDRIYVICEYSPQGNVYVSGGDEFMLFKLNVLPAVAP
jgi:hypothetical protein